MVKCWNHFDEENSAFGTENENTVTGNIMEYLQQTYMNTQKSKEELLVVGRSLIIDAAILKTRKKADDIFLIMF